MSPVKLRHLHHKHGAYYWVGRVGGKVVWRRLAADLPTAMLLYYDLEGRSGASHSVEAALDKYLAVSAKRLAAATLTAYTQHRDKLARVFAEFTDARQVRSVHIAQYLDAASHKFLANREIGLLSAALSYVQRLGWIDSNPCIGVHRHPEPPRRRVFNEGEIAALRAAASDRMRCLIDLALLTGMRQHDLLSLRLADLTDDGIQVEHHKTGARVLYEWTPALREAVDRAKKLRRRVGSMLLFSRPDGQRLGASAIRNAWLELVKKAKVENARFHDLRGTCLTRAKQAGGLDYAQALAGHARQATTEGYIARRDVTKVRPIR